MGIGPVIRKLFGPFEGSITHAYRRFFVDLQPLACVCAELQVTSIIEVGCGEGLFTSLLRSEIPDCKIDGIDVCDGVGRLYQGSSENVRFARCTADTYADDGRSADLVVVCDVLHHIPLEHRSDFLKTVGVLVSPTGSLIIKDWAPSNTLIHLLGYISDRFITGDRVKYCVAEYYQNLLNGWTLTKRGTLPPYDNNFFLVFRRADDC